MSRLNISAFPIHKATFQGVAADEDLTNKTYKIVHADEAGTITVTLDGGTVLDPIAMGAGEDVTISTGTLLTSTMSVKVS